MSQNFARPLSLGNVMSAGITLYRSHLKSYLGMSVKAHLWGLIPIYGWAKFETLKAAIARHGFQELINEPQSLKSAQEILRPKLWGFWVIQILIGLILFGVQTFFNVGFQLLSIPLGSLFSGIDSIVNLTLFLILSLIAIMFFIIFIVVYLWIVSRFLIPELPYAIEGDIDLVKAIERSWRLTSGRAAWQIMIIICVIAAIMTPLYILASIPPLLILISAIRTVSNSSMGTPTSVVFGLTILLVLLLWIVLYVIVSIIVMPMWQALKAAIYYDVRVRKEGLGLALRDRTP